MAYKVAVLLLLTSLLLESAVNSVPDASDNTQCSIGTIYKSSLPTGGNGVEHLTVLGVGMKADDCISKCCSLGPGSCQYLWVMNNMCVAVACESAKLSSCKPKTLTASSKLQSLYVLMDHPHQLEDGLEDALDWVNKIMHKDDKSGRNESGDSPPVAVTPTDEIVITLPNNEVYIYGNDSRDDKGISGYSWKLLTEHFVQPIVEDVDKAILHVSNLIPGTYQFSLTVTDTAGQSSRTTVLIRVIKGPAEVITTGVATATAPSDTTAPPQSETTTPLNETTAGSGSGGNNTANIEDQNAVEENFYTKRRNVLKIVIPVLLSLAVLLVLTAAITTLCACCCERNKHRMKRYYRYKKLPETIEKT